MGLENKYLQSYKTAEIVVKQLPSVGWIGLEMRLLIKHRDGISSKMVLGGVVCGKWDMVDAEIKEKEAVSMDGVLLHMTGWLNVFL